MNYLIFRGVSTQTLSGVYVAQMPSHRKAAMRYTEYYIKGRDGALHVDEGYENFDLTVKLVLIKAAATQRYVVNAWADGTGKLVTSDDTTRAYQASVKGDIQWQRVQANGGFYDTATITFNCQPFMVESVDSQVTITGTQTISNPGSAISYPMIMVNGSGNAKFTVNGSEISIDSMTSGVPVYIDCANGYVYTASGATSMRGDIPYLKMGNNTIACGTGVSSIVLTPHWRWV